MTRLPAARAGGRGSACVPCVELDDRSVRTAGSEPVLTATSADVRSTVVGGRVRTPHAERTAATLAEIIEDIYADIDTEESA